MASRREMPLTPRSQRLFARRADHLTEGVRQGYIDLAMHRKLMKVAADMAAEQTRRWWMPRPDQPWRYDT